MPRGKHSRNKYDKILQRLFACPFVYTILVFLLVKPDSFTVIPVLSKIHSYVAALIFLIMVFIAIWGKKFTKFTIAVCVFQGYFVLVTIVNGGNVSGAAIFFFRVVALCLLVEFGLNGFRDAMLKGVLIAFFAYLLINIGTIVCFPKGLYITEATKNPCYFLGHRNTTFRILLPGLLFAYIYDVRSKGRIDGITIIYYALLLLSIFFVKSANGIVTIVTIPIIYFVLRKLKTIPKHGALGAFLMGVAGTLFFVVFRLQILLSFLIVDLLGKDLTLSSRTRIWDAALQTIAGHPIFGYGLEETEATMARFYNVASSHNYLLDVLYQGGFIALALLLIVVIITDEGLRKSKSHLVTTGIVVCLVASFINGVVEPNGVGLLNSILIFSVAYHSQLLEDNSSSQCLKGMP